MRINKNGEEKWISHVGKLNLDGIGTCELVTMDGERDTEPGFYIRKGRRNLCKICLFKEEYIFFNKKLNKVQKSQLQEYMNTLSKLPLRPPMTIREALCFGWETNVDHDWDRPTFVPDYNNLPD